ncbi:MAG TPA: hypothetical protein VEV87_03380 [Chitinophagaceae bacterium]|nr:hypothetical protein [Chitinophagaceae bacterium]
MRKRLFILCHSFLSFFLATSSVAQQDSILTIDKKVVTLKEVVVRSNLNVPAFIDRVKNDTSFYKAFKNLKVLGYSALNDVRMLNKKGTVAASLQSKTIQTAQNGCRSMKSLDEKITGDIYTKSGGWNYYTLQMYAGLFWVKDTVCGESNIVGNGDFTLKNKSGFEKHKEQLKMLFFNPGARIPGIPFMGDKTAIFEDNLAEYYDYIIDMDQLEGEWCYIFSVKAKEDLSGGQKNKIVINNMTTWFNQQTMDIVKRNYDLSYDAGVYDFSVQIEAELKRFGDYLVPTVLRYYGDWDVMFKKRERGIFTATLFDFQD